MQRPISPWGMTYMISVSTLPMPEMLHPASSRLLRLATSPFHEVSFTRSTWLHPTLTSHGRELYICKEGRRTLRRKWYVDLDIKHSSSSSSSLQDAYQSQIVAVSMHNGHIEHS
jgi:hypothetical protein